LAITDPSWAQDYAANVTGMDERAGGRYLARTAKIHKIESERGSPQFRFAWPLLGGLVSVGSESSVAPPARGLVSWMSCLRGYLGGNCELGTGSARLAVGGLSVKPMTAQLMFTPTDP